MVADGVTIPADVVAGLQRLGVFRMKVPVEYGGLGLTVDHQHAFTEESLPFDMPLTFNVPTLGILAATLPFFAEHVVGNTGLAAASVAGQRISTSKPSPGAVRQAREAVSP